MWFLTWIHVGGAHNHNIFADGNIFKNFVGIAHRIEDRCIIVEIQYVAVDGDGGRQTGMTIVLRLNNENVVLNLAKEKSKFEFNTYSIYSSGVKKSNKANWVKCSLAPYCIGKWTVGKFTFSVCLFIWGSEVWNCFFSFDFIQFLFISFGHEIFIFQTNNQKNEADVRLLNEFCGLDVDVFSFAHSPCGFRTVVLWHYHCTFILDVPYSYGILFYAPFLWVH